MMQSERGLGTIPRPIYGINILIYSNSFITVECPIQFTSSSDKEIYIEEILYNLNDDLEDEDSSEDADQS